jgi:hypothetical protein
MLYGLVVQYLSNFKKPSVSYLSIPNILPDFIYVGAKHTISVRTLTFNGPLYRQVKHFKRKAILMNKELKY